MVCITPCKKEKEDPSSAYQSNPAPASAPAAQLFFLRGGGLAVSRLGLGMFVLTLFREERGAKVPGRQGLARLVEKENAWSLLGSCVRSALLGFQSVMGR